MKQNRFRSRTATIVLFVLTAPVFGETPFRFAADRPVDCLHIKLDLKVNLAAKHVAGTATISVAALRDVTSITLDAVDLDIHGVTVTRKGKSSAPADFTNDGKHVEVPLDQVLKTGDKATITIDYSVDHPNDGLHFFGPSPDHPDVSRVVWSQGESVTNSYWFPCFDNPNEKQTSELVVTAKQGLQVNSNGRLLAKKENPSDGTVTFHWLQDKPHAAYLVTMIVGDFYIERDTWRGKPISYWVPPRFKEQVHRSFRNTKRMLDFFSDKIGIEYPWDRYAQISCEGFGGGMENTSATTLGYRALHDKRSFLDANSDGLISHEMAHQWWGDLLTCRDWAHIWLNEGFASYFEALWAEHDLGDDEFRYNMYRKARVAQRGGKKRPIVDRAYDSPGSMFDARAYPKGAWVLHMMRKRLGDDLFWKVIHRYGTDNAYKSVETVDLRKAAERVTGESFEQFFYDWTQRPGHPQLTVSYRWLGDDKLAKVSITQTQKKDAFHFPLKLAFRLDNVSSPIVVSRDITDKKEIFYYPLPRKPHLFRVDPDYTVLAEIKQTQGWDMWKAQLLDDPDPIARIRAAKHFGESSSDRDRKLLAQALKQESFWGVQREIAGALGDTGGDIARDALIAGLQFKNHKARRACVEQLDSFPHDPMVIAAVKPIVEHGDASYYVEAEAIETYAELEPDDAMEVLQSALSRDSRNEVIRSAALEGLGHVRDPKVVPLLAEWTKPDKPRSARPSAIEALADVTQRTLLDDRTMRLIVDTLVSCLDDNGRRIRGQAVRALGSLHDPGRASSALTALETLAAHDPQGRIRTGAKKVIKTIRSGEPTQLKLADLRKELEQVLEENKHLTDRLGKLEAQILHTEKRAEQKAASPAATDHPTGR